MKCVTHFRLTDSTGRLQNENLWESRTAFLQEGSTVGQVPFMGVVMDAIAPQLMGPMAQYVPNHVQGTLLLNMSVCASVRCVRGCERGHFLKFHTAFCDRAVSICDAGARQTDFVVNGNSAPGVMDPAKGVPMLEQELIIAGMASVPLFQGRKKWQARQRAAFAANLTHTQPINNLPQFLEAAFRTRVKNELHMQVSVGTNPPPEEIDGLVPKALVTVLTKELTPALAATTTQLLSHSTSYHHCN